MELPRKAIEDYKKAYKEEFGREISNKEAQGQAFELLSLFKIIYRPIPKSKKEQMKRIIEEYEENLKRLD